MKEQIAARGALRIWEQDPETGLIRPVAYQENVITTQGKALLARAFVTATPSWPEYMAIGTGSTAAAAADTALQNEVIRGAIGDPTQDGPVAFLTWNIPSDVGVGETFREAGLVTAEAGGTLFNRVVLDTPYTKTATNLPIFTFEITFN